MTWNKSVFSVHWSEVVWGVYSSTQLWLPEDTAVISEAFESPQPDEYLSHTNVKYMSWANIISLGIVVWWFILCCQFTVKHGCNLHARSRTLSQQRALLQYIPHCWILQNGFAGFVFLSFILVSRTEGLVSPLEGCRDEWTKYHFSKWSTARFTFLARHCHSSIWVLQ